MDSGKPDHKNPALQRYKNELKMKVDAEMGIQQKAPIQKKEEQKVEEKPEPVKPKVEEKKQEINDIDAIFNNEPEKKSEVKKPRTFVAENDLFDFSDVKIITGSENEKIPTAIDEKPKQIKPMKKNDSIKEK